MQNMNLEKFILLLSPLPLALLPPSVNLLSELMETK